MSLRPKSLDEAKAQRKRAAAKKKRRAARAAERTTVDELRRAGVVQTADEVALRQEEERYDRGLKRLLGDIAAAQVAAPGAPPVAVTTARPPARPPQEKASRWVSARWLAGVRRGTCVVPVQVEGADDGVTRPCGRKGTDPHHVELVGRRGDRFDLLVVPMCRQHHDAAHAGRIERQEMDRMLGAYLRWQLPRVPKSVALVVVQQFLDGLERA